MRSLGYSETWRTQCFLGCDRIVWAHTNGYGDFVLLNEVRPPWPIHECYDIRADSDSEPTGIDRSWVEVTPTTPDTLGKKRHSCLATVTNITKGALGADEAFARLPQTTQVSIRKALEGRSSLLTFVDGNNGGEFSAFIDLKKMPAGFRDIVAIDIRSVDLPNLINRRAFVVTHLQVLCPASHT